MNFEINDIELGKRIKKARENKNLSQQKVYELTGISPPQLSALENGHRTIGLQSLSKISEAIGVTMDSLYFGKEECYPITKAKNDSELIINCLYELTRREIIGFIKYDDDEYNCSSYYIGIKKYEDILGEFIANIHKFNSNYDYIDNHDSYKDSIVKLAINKLNKEIK